MTLDELRSNVEKTNKIIAYALKTNLGRDYSVEVNKLDWDYSVDLSNILGLYAIIYQIQIEAESLGHMEVEEINSFLTEQEQAISKVLDSEKSTVGKNGLFGPRTNDYQMLGPNVDGIDFNIDFFKTTWIVEISPEP